MRKQIMMAGLLGGTVMLVWLVISNAILGFKNDIIHKIPPHQLEIHAVLKANITEPGTYVCPYLSPLEENNLMADYRNQPVYAITYTGFTHGDSLTILTFAPVLIFFLVPGIAAWMLSRTTVDFRTRYYRRALFVALVGCIVALYDDILQMSFGPQDPDYLVFLAVNNVATWLLVGLAVAGQMKPRSD